MTKILDIVDLLEQDDSLDLGGSPWGHEVENDNFDTHQVDWDRLFPKKAPEDQGRENDWVMYGDEWEVDIETLEDILTGPMEKPENENPEEWDVCAWYQPIHFHALDWGIFVKESCLVSLARKIFGESGESIASMTPRQRNMFGKGLIRTAFSVFYHHELYHHKTECLGLRIHAVQHFSSFLRYFRNVYKVADRTDNQIEEALANAFMYREVNASRWVPTSLAEAARRYLLRTFPHNPPGYRLAGNYLTKHKFFDGQRELFSRVLEGSLSPSHSPAYWNMAPRMNNAIFNITSDIWTVVPRGGKAIVPTTATPLKTCSSNQMVKVCNEHGYSITSGGKGSHIKLKKPGNPTLIIPGNRDNVSPGVAKSILESLGYKLNQLPDLL